MSYDIPFWDSGLPSKKITSFNTILQNIKSIALIGKGASIFESDSLKLIRNCDYRVCLNSVDLENVRSKVGGFVDAQATTQVSRVNSLMPVYPKTTINKFSIKTLICNNQRDYKNNLVLNDYFYYFNDRVDTICCLPSDNFYKIDLSLDKYNKGRITIAGSMIRVLVNMLDLKKIVFAGIDAFHYGYSYRKGIKSNDMFYYDINACSADPLETHGKPFIEFLRDIMEIRNKISSLDIYIPLCLKENFNLPKKPYFKYY